MEPEGVEGGAGLVDTPAPVTQDTTPVGTDNGGQAPTGENPAWAELLGVVPSSLHPTVKPYLEKWEKGVNDRFTKVQSEYAPYKDLIGIDPQQIVSSMQLAQMIASDPRAFYDRMTEHYGAEWGLAGQGQGADNADDYSLDGLDDGNDDLSNNPLIQQIREQQDTIANFLAMQMQQQEEAQQQQMVAEAGNQIQSEISAIAKSHGMESLPPQAEKMLISLALQNNVTLEEAAQEVMPLFANAAPRPSATVLTPGGGVPQTNLDPAKMGASDTKALVAQMLAQAHATNG